MHDTEVTLSIEAVARAIYVEFPAIQGWDGDPYAFHEDGATLCRERALRAAKSVEAELVRASTVTTEAELNALPEETIIRAEVHRERPGGRRTQVIARIYEKRDMRRNEWLELDPSDRDDGEETVPASLIVNYYGTNGCRVLFRPV